MSFMRYSFISLAVALCLAASCAAPKEVAYFQNAADNSLQYNVPTTGAITLRPEDKIGIIVNTRDPQLTTLFNLPYIANRVGSTTDARSAGNNSTGVLGYTVDSNGDIDFPIVGKLHVAGLQRSEVADCVKEALLSRSLVKDPVVTVEFMNLTYSVLGEVNNPGRYSIEKDRVSVLDAIGAAGDLAIYGRRDNILVVRTADSGEQMRYFLNLTRIEDVMASPAYYLQQGDVVYVTPNDMRIRQSTVNGNNVRSTSFWISLASLAATLTSTIAVLTR